MWKWWTAHYLMENTQSVLMVFGEVGRKDGPAEAGKDQAKAVEGLKEAGKDRAEDKAVFK